MFFICLDADGNAYFVIDIYLKMNNLKKESLISAEGNRGENNNVPNT